VTAWPLGFGAFSAASTKLPAIAIAANIPVATINDWTIAIHPRLLLAIIQIVTPNGPFHKFRGDETVGKFGGKTRWNIG